MPKSHRIRTEIGVDKYINVNLEQDWESLEILSLKILANDVYTRFCADYGVVTGRVFVNGGFGLPNSKVSIFIPLEPQDELDPVITELYPFKSISDTNEEGYRYNLLPKLPSYDGHSSTGSFPNKGDVLMNESFIEVFDKYYRLTVTTNESGDFMIFGVPLGTQTIVMDVDLSDIGCFSLTPQDLIQQGLATETQVNGARFKSSTNLRELPQIKNLVFDIDVRPFWGDLDICQVGITRVDFDLTKLANFTIQPTAIFMGSIISTTDDDALKVGCKPKNNTGNLCEIVSGPGEIKAIRQTIFSDQNGLPILENYDIEQGGKVIDGDGTYLVNVQMNMDYVFTNEFGQQVISNDPKKGVPTKGKYRFKFRWQNEQGLQSNFLKADFLVPNIKEYGWQTSSNDPFANNSSVYNYTTIPVGQTSGSITTFGSDFGFSVLNTNNIESYQILINGQPYLGTLNSIQLLAGVSLQIIATPVDPTVVMNISFTQYPQPLFDLYRSYAFSTDWDDYADVQEAIDCEDTFYEFTYNKVYTTAMFLDRYKNGIGRARHLGIKEIDNRSCKSTVNTFPVNDIIRNFDFIFFVFNILINILTFPILTLLFIAHFIALLWPIIKALLLFLGPYLIYQGVSAGIDLGYYIGSLFNISALGIPVISVATIIQIIAQGLKVIFLVAAGTWFTIWYTKFFVDSLNDGKVDNFPRIGLPMISYPDCTSCDCDCGVAVLDDDITTQSIQSEIDELEEGGGSSQLVLSEPKGVIAPFNSAGSYSELNHPNLSLTEDGDDPYDCGGILPYFQTLSTLLGNDEISQDVVVRAVLDFKRMASGYDVLSSTDPFKYIQDESYLLKAPQPFLFSAEEFGGGGTKDERYFGYPISVPLSQRLNEFNTRDKYFSAGGGVNQIRTWVNPSVNSSTTIFTDQVLVVIMNQGASSSIGYGKLLTFQDPNSLNGININRKINLTGATLNQFDNNAITGSTKTGTTVVNISYANPSSPTLNFTTSISITGSSVSQLSVVGDPSSEQSYLEYATDVEYFQLITGLTISQFETLSGSSPLFFPNSYLNHDLKYIRPGCFNFNSITETVSDVIKTMNSYENFEVCIFVRGVDPHTQPQTINYDLSKIFGHNTQNTITVEGSYYLNVPIKAQTTLKPQSHNTLNNSNSNLYFPSYTFTIDPSPTNYTGFTSNLPYFYLSTDDTSVSSLYSPYPSVWTTNVNSTINSLLQTNPNSQSLPFLPTFIPNSTYVLGGTYLRWNAPFVGPFVLKTGDNQSSPPCDQKCQRKQYYNAPSSGGYFIYQSNLTALYSPVYYRQLTNGVNFSDSTRIVMRSDRLPTSTSTQNGTGPQTGFALHQNDNFLFYGDGGIQSSPSISAGGDLASGESNDDDPITIGLTETLSCEGMVPLACYSGSGSNVGVLPDNQCSIPENRMINGCYCLLNKKYVKEYGLDVRLFLEWKVRFTMNFAACRGVFAQVFQNNWINGVLYMFSFNKRTTFGVLQEPEYNYCEDVIIFNELRNIFFYRSSPWNDTTQQFVGKDKPNTPMFSNLISFPGLGYNDKQIQFPTTVVDLGPRDSFINEVCCSSSEDGFGSYYVDQIKSTSYQDNSDIVQLGFLSRILNEGVRQRITPISNGGNNSEGKGIVQFFNSTREGYRIDGDFAQMLSINSEWKVLPFITENVPNNSFIYFGDNRNNGPSNSIASQDIKPVLGLFFTADTEEIRYRKIMSPGIETYSFSPLLEEQFGYPKSQNVPNYRWAIKEPSVSNGTPTIFGSEDNNWYTNTGVNTGFYQKKYQDLDFDSPSGKYQTNLTKVGYLASFDITGGTLPITPLNNIIQGAPSTTISTPSVTLVGAPYHFYFGLNNGKTAINRFYKLYVPTLE